MFIRFNGTSAVDIPSHDGVQPGEVIEVDDELGHSLLLAGYSFPDPIVDADGNVTPVDPVPPADLLWVPATAKEHKAFLAAATAPAPEPAPAPAADPTTTPQEG